MSGKKEFGRGLDLEEDENDDNSTGKRANLSDKGDDQEIVINKILISNPNTVSSWSTNLYTSIYQQIEALFGKEPNVDENLNTGRVESSSKQHGPNRDSSSSSDSDDKVLLFEIEISNSNRLRIPYELAGDYFKPAQAPPRHLREQILHLTDYLKREWQMAVACFPEEDAYIVMRGWHQYANEYNLKHSDTIRFCRQRNPPSEDHYVIEHELRRPPVLLDHAAFPQFVRENFLLQLELTQDDVEYGRLAFSEEGKVLFKSENRQEMVKLTDEKNKDWYMIIVFAKPENMIMDGWEQFVMEHELKALDLVKFYTPVRPLYRKHVLIQCEKKEHNPVQPGDRGGWPSRKGKEIVDD